LESEKECGITLLIEPLTREHDRKSFDCGDEQVTSFFRERALQDQSKDLSRTMVLVAPDVPKQVIGHHTLLFNQVRQDEIPNDRPRITRDIPVILLGQLGVESSFQGRGIGDLLLTDAQARVTEIAAKIGVRALMLDARNERLADWYEQHDFIRFPGSLRMFKSIDAIRKLDLI
jgi:GNAT superfamily N-acetyltransferase